MEICTLFIRCSSASRGCACGGSELAYSYNSIEIETAIAIAIDSYETRCPYAGGIARNPGKSYHNCFVYLKIIVYVFSTIEIEA